MVWQDRLDELQERIELAHAGGEPDRIARQHDRGQYTIRERLDRILDPWHLPRGRRPRRGRGVRGRRALPGSRPRRTSWASARSTGGTSPSAARTSPSAAAPPSSSSSATRAATPAASPRTWRASTSIPLVLLIEGGGGNVQSMRIRWRAAALRRQLPVPARRRGDDVRALSSARCSATAAGGPAGRSQLVHWSVMTKETSAVFAAGPPVVRRTMGQELTPFELGGAHIHVRESGCIDNEAADEEDAFRQVRRLPLLHALQHLRAAPRRRVQRRAAGPGASRRHRAARPASPLLDAQDPALDARRGLDLRDQAALRAEPDHGLRAHQRASRSA